MAAVLETEGAPARGAVSRHFYRWELDLVRVAAFALVFCQHGLPQHANNGKPANLLTAVSYAGGFGVRLFFVLSAYLLTRLLLMEHARSGRIAVRSFYLRRTLRIWPLYFVFIVACLPWKTGGIFGIPGIEPGHLGGTLTFTLNWQQGFDPPRVTSMSGIMWSLAAEEQMYLIWPIMLVVLLRYRRLTEAFIVLGILGVLSRVIVTAVGVSYPAVWVLTPTAFDSFAIGGLLALYSERRIFIIQGWMRPVLMLVPLVVLVATTWIVGINVYDGWTAVWTYLLVNLLCGLAVVGALGSSKPTIDPPRSRAAKICVWAGRRSYGLYVWHRMAIAAVVASFSATAGNQLRYFPVALALTILMAWTSYSVLERPFLRLKARRATVESAPV